MLPVAYVAGYGRSGSTLLARLLAERSDVVATGELFQLFTMAEGGTVRCACGETALACGYWGPVLATLRQAVLGDPATWERVRLKQEADPWIRWAGKRRVVGSASSYRVLTRSLFRTVSATAGADRRVLVDSSKTAYRAAARPLALCEVAGLELHVVHIIRDPRAVVWSVLGRGTNRALEGGRHRPWLGWLAPLVGWRRANRVAERLKAQVGAGRYLRLRYEDLVADPGGQVRRIRSFLGLPPDASTAAAGDVHQLAGNRARFAPTLEVRADIEWQDRLPPLAQRLVVLAARGPMRRYGYLTETTAIDME